MALFIRDPETDRLVRKLAERKGMTLTQAVHHAASRELGWLVPDEPRKHRRPLRERIKKIQAHLASFPKSDAKADKAFYDWLAGDE